MKLRDGPHILLGVCLVMGLGFALGVLFERSKDNPPSSKLSAMNADDWWFQYQLLMLKNQDLAKRYRETLEAYADELRTKDANRSEREKLRAIWDRRSLAYYEWWEKTQLAIIDAMTAYRKAQAGLHDYLDTIWAQRVEAQEVTSALLRALARKYEAVGRRDGP